MSEPRPSPWRWLAVVIYAGGIFAASSIPGRSLPDYSVFELDKVIHLLVFAGLSSLTYWAWNRPVVAILAASSYGLLDELHQRFSAGRHASSLDLLADVIGAVTGVALLIWWRRWRARDGNRS